MSSKNAEANSDAHNGFQTSYGSTVTVTHDPIPKGSKSLLDAYILLLPLGFFGAHHFYLKRPGWGILYLFTFGLCGLGWLLDFFRLPNLVQSANYKSMYPNCPVLKSQNLGDTWIIGFCPITGLLGFHHYYLGRIGWGVLYTCTLGLFGLGWFIDNIRMPFLVKRANMTICGVGLLDEEETHGDQAENHEPFKGYYLDDVYVLAFNPFGILGLHHFYLKRVGWGILYLLTFGVFGLGWLVDLFRMKMLVDKKNFEICHQDHARYHHSNTPNYGTSSPPKPEPYNQYPDYQPGQNQPGPGSDYRPGGPNYQHVPGSQPPDTHPTKGGNSQYPSPTHPGFPNAHHGPPPPYAVADDNK